MCWRVDNIKLVIRHEKCYTKTLLTFAMEQIKISFIEKLFKRRDKEAEKDIGFALIQMRSGGIVD
jgi:hypothetical protein